MKSWQVQEAKARFSELLRAAADDGPQLVSHHGKPAAMVVPYAQWQRLQQRQPPDLKALLRSPRARGELALPARGRLRSRTPPTFA